MNENDALGGILRDLVMLASECADVRAGKLSDADYQKHCELVYQRIEAAYPPQAVTS